MACDTLTWFGQGSYLNKIEKREVWLRVHIRNHNLNLYRRQKVILYFNCLI